MLRQFCCCILSSSSHGTSVHTLAESSMQQLCQHFPSSIPQVIWGNVNPQWGETHNLYVQERSKALLKLRVVDKNKLMSDVDLGVVMTGLDALLAKPGRRVELPLKGEGCGCCSYSWVSLVATAGGCLAWQCSCIR